MAVVSNLTNRVLYVPGRKEPLEAYQVGAQSDAKEETLRGHLFCKAGYISVEGTSVRVEAPVKTEPTPEPEPTSEPEPEPELSPLEAAKQEATDTQDIDRLIELSKDDRKTVAKIAQKRLDEMGE